MTFLSGSAWHTTRPDSLSVNAGWTSHTSYSQNSATTPLTSIQALTSRLVFDKLWQLWQNLWLNQPLPALGIWSKVIPYRPAGR